LIVFVLRMVESIRLQGSKIHRGIRRAIHRRGSNLKDWIWIWIRNKIRTILVRQIWNNTSIKDRIGIRFENKTWWTN
jgi:hypothetical protein